MPSFKAIPFEAAAVLASTKVPLVLSISWVTDLSPCFVMRACWREIPGPVGITSHKPSLRMEVVSWLTASCAPLRAPSATTNQAEAIFWAKSGHSCWVSVASERMTSCGIGGPSFLEPDRRNKNQRITKMVIAIRATSPNIRMTALLISLPLLLWQDCIISSPCPQDRSR